MTSLQNKEIEVNISKVQDNIVAIQKARLREDKVLKKPEARKFSISNFNERIKFHQNGENTK